MKKIVMAGLTAAALTSGAYAGCTADGCTNVQVTKLYMTADGILYVATSGDEKALDCAAGAGNGGVSGMYMSLKEGDVGKNAMYSLLLTAKTTNKPVSVRIQNGTPDCRVLYVTID